MDSCKQVLFKHGLIERPVGNDMSRFFEIFRFFLHSIPCLMHLHVSLLQYSSAAQSLQACHGKLQEEKMSHRKSIHINTIFDIQ
jgi:hypothetical protein